MNKRNRLMALLGASVLTLGIAGVALATDLLTGQVGTKLSAYYDATECAKWPADAPAIGAGQIGVHFVLTSPEASSGNLTAEFTNPVTHLGSTPDYDSPAVPLHWYVVITGDGNTVINSASTDVDGDNLVVSHACPGATVTAPPETAAPTPSFEQSQEGFTDTPTEPSTDAFGGNGTSGPAGGAWLLVVALGVLLASIVVLTPARAKGRR